VTLTHPAEAVFLGMDGDGGVFAADLSELGEAEALTVAGASATADVRAMFDTLTADEAAILAYARGLVHWHRRQRFCGTCGGRTDSRNGGHARACPPCDRLLFPRIEPAVIVLVESAGRCLLGRHNGQGEGVYSTLAGFVEVGESLEEAVRREVLEEDRCTGRGGRVPGITGVAVPRGADDRVPRPCGLRGHHG
jgi:NAD+ diphosphatase